MLAYPDSILALELTDHCNCRCVMCTQSVLDVIHGHRKGFMDPGLVQSILDDLTRHGVRLGKLLPFGLGESTIHPQCREILRQIFTCNARHHLFEQVDLHTNAIALTDDLQELLLEFANQLGSITFSLDAARAGTFQKIRGSDCFDRARSHVMEFLRRRQKTGKTQPTAILQFIVMEDNTRDAEPFLNFWKQDLASQGIDYQVNWDWEPPMISDTIFFKRVNPFSRMDLTGAEKLHRQTLDKLGLLTAEASTRTRLLTTDEHLPESVAPRRPCSGPFKYINVAWDGLATVCCIDTERKLAIGTVTPELPLTELWENDANRRLRMAHITGDLQDFPVCDGCRNLDGPRITDEEILDWLQRKRDGDSVLKYKQRMGLA